jgi:polyisoprenyl-phosphate glycosyltransferase
MIRRVALVTPVFEDWASLAALLADIANEFTGAGVAFHVYAVDDGSVGAADLSAIALPPDACIEGIEIVHLALNLGHQRAIAVGLCEVAERTDIDAVIVMDSDGEDRPVDIATLLAAHRQNPGHIVLAQRAKRSETRIFRAGYFLYKLLFRALTGRSITFGNYSLLPMPAVRRLVHMPELWTNLAASVIRSRLPYRTVPTTRGTRYHGRPGMNLAALIVHGLSAMSVHTDTIFVRLLLAASTVASVAAVGIAIIAMIRFATDLAIPGWATTAVGDLLIILLQVFVTVIAVSLMMLAGRSNRPIIPVADCRAFVAHRETCRLDRNDAAPAAVPGLA